ncbi:Macrophage colony-stimulating factor 1 receptor [Podospora pseudoanserina]|uniref:Macrophage colony-stimulating factor 1 receptor n=1 Tax=Podospora pseudoanserina TaxID=2609844 RepID=A0ABR0HSY4_9PEZI|nr:Macrophage colony-stimulating factor 1 receptor [Podospora pseudoanserina]
MSGWFSNETAFNAQFCGILIACGVLSTFSLLYFNRVFASIVSWGIRTYTWHQYRIYIDIQALQISLLAGRIFFTGLRYHGNNETILVQNGHITWAYWLRRVRHVEIGKAKGKGNKQDVASDEHSRRTPCRVVVSLRGLEWFIYNRSPAYDSIVAGLSNSEKLVDEVHHGLDDKDVPAGPPSRLRRRPSRRSSASRSPSAGRFTAQNDRSDTQEKRRDSFLSSASDTGRDEESSSPSGVDDIPLFLQTLPIHLKCKGAAMVMGNENTTAVLIVKTESFSGEIDATATETDTTDPYRQCFRLKFKHPVIEMKENPDFKEDQVNRAEREKQSAQGSLSPPKKRSFLRGQKSRLREGLRGFIPFWNKSVESFSPSSRGIGTAASQVPGSGHWQGLSRYLSEEAEDQKSRWSSIEYAAVPTLLDSPEATLTIYWDVPGLVQPMTASPAEKAPELLSNINGDEPPAWAIKLSINGGSVNYGPWADRHRAELQRIFVPSLCKDAVPTPHLVPGAYRVPTQFKFYLELEDTTNIRIPVREESKNWRWKGKEPDPNNNTRANETRKSRARSKKSDQAAKVHQRPYGWLDIKAPVNTTVTYSMDMTAGSSGYSNSLNVDFPSTEISSSINHEVLWKSGRQRISCDLSTPLRWNSLRQWHFNIASDDLSLFLLRDHIFLLTDLVDDWTTGPPPDYMVFTPFRYHVNLQLPNVRIFLNLNDANIINSPTDLDDNTFLIISSPLLRCVTSVPIDTFRPSKNAIPFDIRAENASVDLHVPPWNTQAPFLTSKEVGHLENLVVDGAYHYNATTSPSNIDTIVLNISGQSPFAQLHGFLVRYMLVLKDNYFGEDVHFKTLEEYQDMLRLKANDPSAELANKPPPKKTNDLDVILSIRADDPKILLPVNLYSCQRHIRIDTANLALDLRFTNYYMDMELTLAPLNLSLGNTESGAETPISATSSTQLFVDGITVYGHRLFGLPPAEPTYMCNWDLSVGAVTGECTAEFLTTLVSAGKAFVFCLDDEENALIILSSIVVYDVTFLRVFVESVQIWIHVEEAAFLLSTGLIDVNFNDWAGSHYSKRANVKIPDIKLSCVNAESATRYKTRPQHPVETDALVETSVRLAMIGRKANFSEERRLQQELIRRHDQRTHRTPFLVLPGFTDDFVPELVDPPSQSVPPVPLPLTIADVGGDDRASLNSRGTSRRSRGLRHKSSFLSIASSGQSSILKPASSPRPSGLGKQSDQYLRSPVRHRFGGRGSLHGRELSPSTRHSAFYSAPEDSQQRQDVVHNTVAFSSQYFAPYFPLENVKPSHKEVLLQSIEADDDDDDFDSSDFNLGDIDPSQLSEELPYTGVLVEFPNGLTAFCNPTSLRHVATLLGALQPVDPDVILDAMQISSVQEVLDMQKDQHLKGRIGDILVKLPHANLRLVNSSDPNSIEQPMDEQDQYDVALSKLVLTSRTETTWNDAFKPESKEARTSFHVRLDSAAVSATERYQDMAGAQAAAVARIDNVAAAMGTKDVSYLDVEIGNFQSSTSSEKVDYLASLIHRAGVLGADLGKVFAEVSLQEGVRSRNLVRRLVSSGKNIQDPSFLIRPSSVLRSASQHLRTYDSWKLIMRLRQTWSVLAPSIGEQIKMDCFAPLTKASAQLRQEVVSAFEKWRSWDLENVSESVLLNIVFGPPAKAQSNGGSDKPVMAVARIKQFQVALNPGPKQNAVTLVDLTTRLQVKPALQNQAGDQPAVLVNVHCEDAAVSLNWELCELASSILRMAKKMQSKPELEPEPENAARPKTPVKVQRQTVHCVLSLDHGSLILEAVNLYSSSFSNGTKISVLATRKADNTLNTNGILSCDSVSSSLRSHHQKLAKLVLEQPSVFVSHELQATQTTDSHTIKTTASNQYMNLTIRQDPVTLAEVLDLLVRDEFAQLYKLKDQLFPPSPRNPSPPKKKMADRLSAFKANAALFMDQYTITVPLLSSLTYTIHGTVSRAAMAADFGKELIFDFDIKENQHDIQVRVNNVARSISLLQIPPASGRIISHIEPGEHTISVYSSVELVQLDASAVYSLLSALNRPEISNAVSELQQQGRVIREHVDDVVGHHQQQDKPLNKDKKTETIMAYSTNLTFAGLEVFGNSPLPSEKEPVVANVLLRLDRVHVGVNNRVDGHGTTLSHPQFDVNLRGVRFEIRKGRDDGGDGGMRSCGSVAFGAVVTGSSQRGEDGEEEERRFFNVKSDGFRVELSPETVSTVVDVLGYMGDKIKDLDTSKELEYLKKLRQSRPRIMIDDGEGKARGEEEGEEEGGDIIDAFFSSVTYTFEMQDILVAWLVGGGGGGELEMMEDDDKEDLVLSLERIEFGTRTRNSARLTIENLQLQMVNPAQQDKKVRSSNSALLPEIIFKLAYVSTAEARRLAFQAVGKSLDLRLTSGCIIPAAKLNDSISLSLRNVQRASQNWNPVVNKRMGSSEPVSPDRTQEVNERKTGTSIFGKKRMESLLVDADFAGAVVHLSGKKAPDDIVSATRVAVRPGIRQGHDGTTAGSTVLRSPGLAWKVEYRDNARDDPSLHAEVKLDPSTNILSPSVVPLIVDISNSIKHVVSSRENDRKKQPSAAQSQAENIAAKVKLVEEDSILTADPTAVLGRMKLNLGLRICKQEFSLSCHPIAQVAATASFEDVYFTANTVRSIDHGNFFALSGAFTNLQASVKHVYSREPTGSFKVQSIVLSLLNSRHVSGTSGVSAILKVSPMEVSVNAKQLQDFLLFREIWLPREVLENPMVDAASSPIAKLATETSQGHLVQRYQQVARTAAFPWTASISITALKINVDLGQALGKSTFSINDFWVSSKKTSDWEQNLCLGFKMIGIESTGRMSGFVTLQDFKLRTSIEWPQREQALNETPMIQASVGFSQLRVKAAFDYQAFLVADVRQLEFLMYNVRRSKDGTGDRLVAIFDGEAVQVFGTTSSAAQGVAMWQAIQRLVKERREGFEVGLKEVERYMKRRRVEGVEGVVKRLSNAQNGGAGSPDRNDPESAVSKSPISLDTDVVVTLRAVNLGVFPSTFSDHQVFKMEALNAQARFAASVGEGRIHSILGLTLGQLRIGLAGVRNTTSPKTLSELSVEDVVTSATGSRGGTILKVPQVEAVMQTWQAIATPKQIDYIFKSAFEGKVEVGWNYSRISYIRGMWANHAKTLAQTWGRELPSVAGIKVTEDKTEGKGKEGEGEKTEKITAEVQVPMSKYEYRALEEPVIETPQLRDMGEATPPLEWIGLHRERLPNLVHQIVIVALLELAGEVEDAYEGILGSS